MGSTDPAYPIGLRRTSAGPGVAWSIDGDLVVELAYRESKRDRILVHDIALLDVLKTRLCTRHVEVACADTTWD